MLSLLFVCRTLLTAEYHVSDGPGAACGVPGVAMESSYLPRHCRRPSEERLLCSSDARERKRPSSLPLHPSTLRRTSSNGDPCHALPLEQRPSQPRAPSQPDVPNLEDIPEAHTPVADVIPESATCESRTHDAVARPESRTPESSATLVPLTPEPDATSESRTPESHTSRSRRTTPESHSDATSLKSRPRHALSGARSVKRKGFQARQGRPRRALYVATPLPPQPREHPVGRAQTEPPPSPNILQVSWVWESSRHTSLRRRPSRRVSCRWKKPRVMPRRAPLRGVKMGGIGDDLLEDNGGDADGDDTVVIWQVPRQEAEAAGRSTTGRLQGEDRKDKGFLRRRAKSESATSPAKPFKRKWRHSEILFPRVLTEALQTRPEESGDKSRTLLQKAKSLPGYMKKVSHVLFKTSKDDDEASCVVRRTGASTFYVEVEDCPQELPGAVLAETTGADASQGTKRHSPSLRGGFLRPRRLNWNQKYKRAMEQCRTQGPNICVTSPEGQEEDGDAKNEDGKGLLGRIFGQLRPRSGSTSTSRSYVSSRSSMSGGSEDGHSPPHSSDYEEQDEAERTGSASLVGRMRGLRRDMQKKISRLKSPRGSTSSSPGPLGPLERPNALAAPGTSPHPVAASCDSIPSSVPPAAPPSGSNRSSLSGEDAEPYTGPFIGRAKALVDCQPSPYDRDALKFKKGDTIDIIAKNPSGLWKGCVDGRVGHFKFILVEEEVERPVRKTRAGRGTTPRRGRSRTLEELLTRLHLGHLIQVFMLNGYEDLEHFRDMEKADLDCLGITDPETCAKLLTAVALIHDVDSEPEPDLPETLETTEAALRRGDHGRDSGCYTDHRCCAHPPSVLDENNLDTRQSTPSTDTSSGYHSRGPYNIPVGEGGQAMRDDAHSSALDSPPSEATTTTSGTATLPSSTSDSHSYRAHPATVLPASPRLQSRHAHHQGNPRLRHDDPDVDYEAKFVTARNVFEKEVVRREVPVSVRGQKHDTDSQQAAEEAEQAGSSEADGDATVSPP
ncbi:SAM and SH3 domain-containing protein 1 [Chionoecetes opilio]|uniref:SAM and SH3 domain-containing protein 1 n=1 Tax=Chionoecetes opilio TaxID=41210 RepID=A0A8J4YD22_CHIOP|nr:SAM and SH3 domain-containing protein 1 [Chionoecetes opilio]